MIRRSTVVYILLLAALIGTYVFLKNRPEQTPDAETTVTAEPTVEVTFLFPAEQGTPASVRLESKSREAVELARDVENAWVLKLPIEAKADPAAAEAAASQATTIRILDRVPEVDPEIVGLEVPEYVLTITFTSGTEQTIEVGTLTPSESGYYVRKPEGEVLIVSRDGLGALLGLLENPPYLETPTPGPTADPTATSQL